MLATTGTDVTIVIGELSEVAALKLKEKKASKERVIDLSIGIELLT
jgi:hypothetical protein